MRHGRRYGASCAPRCARTARTDARAHGGAPRAHGHDPRAWWARGPGCAAAGATSSRRTCTAGSSCGSASRSSSRVDGREHGAPRWGGGRGHWLLAMLAAGFVLWLISGKIALPDRAAAARAPARHRGDRRGAALGARRRCRRGTWARSRTSARPSTTWRRASRSRSAISASCSRACRTRSARRSRASASWSSSARSRGGDPKTFDELEREVVEIDALVGQLLASARLDFADLSVRTLDAADVARRALERAGVAEATACSTSQPPGAGARRSRATRRSSRARSRTCSRTRAATAAASRASACAPRAGAVVFEVDDAGPGFPAAGETRERGDRHEGSLGLGLVLVRRIADAHHGRVDDLEPAPRAARA